jgi:pimeloyl-ACP methyl ester carboxylesterase
LSSCLPTATLPSTDQRGSKIRSSSIGGGKANGDALARQTKLIASTATSLVLPDTGHWLVEERPAETAEALMQFLSNHGRTASTTPQLRISPTKCAR